MRNIEALKNYFLGRDPQLHETCADNSLRLIGIPGREFVLRKEFIDKLKELKTRVDTEDERLQAEIDGLIRDLEAEASIRQNQDNILSRDIYDEELARKNADNILTNTFNNYYTKTEIDNQRTFTKLTSDLRIPENEPINPLDLPTGWYNTGEYGIYNGDGETPFTLPNALFYYNSDPENPYFVFEPGGVDGIEMIRAFAWFDIDNHEWVWEGNWMTHTISNSSTDYEIPSAAAVSEYMVYKAGDTMTGQLTTPNLVVGSAGGLLGNNSMANGANNTVTGDNSHAEGQGTVASGDMQHTEGGFNEETTTETVDLPTQRATVQLMTQRVIGGTETMANLHAAEAVKNAYQDGVYAQVVGNGVSGAKPEYRSNAYTLDWDGNAWFAGNVFVGSTSGKHKDAGSKRLVTEDEYNQLLDQIPTTTVTGETINVKDSSNLPLKSFELQGNATQDGEATPETPQAIHVVTGDNTVKLTGKNLFNEALLSQWTGYNTYNSTTGLWTTSDISNWYRSILYYISGNNTRDVTKLIPLMAVGQYTIKIYDFINNTSNVNPINYRLFDRLGAQISGELTSNTTYTITTTEPCYLDICRTASSGTLSFSKIQVEYGNIATAYTPYQEQSVTLPLGDIELQKTETNKDRIYKNNNKWYLEKNIFTKTIVGTEGMSQVTPAATPTPRTTVLIATSALAKDARYISNRFIYGDQGSNRLVVTTTGGGGTYISLENTITGIEESDTTEQKTAKIRNWLSNNNVIFNYCKPTPTTTEITDTALITALEQVLAMTTYKTTTNGFTLTVSDNATPTLVMEYRQDLQTLTDQIATLEARVTLLES